MRPPSGSRSANVTAVPGPQTAPVALPAEIDVSNGSLAVIASAAQLANICLTALILIAVTPDQRASWLPSSAPPARGTLTRLRSPGRSVAARPGTSPIARA